MLLFFSHTPHVVVKQTHYDMLKITEGDLFEYAAPGSIIAHGCNSLGVMGSGFADEIRRRFPMVHLHYLMLGRKRQLKLGSYVQVYTRGYSIYNLITQKDYGRDKDVVYVDYDALAKSLKYVADYCHTHKETAHFPLIGGGLANGDKDRLISIYTDTFKHSDGILYLKKD